MSVSAPVASHRQHSVCVVWQGMRKLLPVALALAVLRLPVLGALGEVTPQRIDAAIDRGVAHLLRLYGDGYGRNRAGPPSGPELVDKVGLRALTAYTLVKSGVPTTHPVVERLIQHLSIGPNGGTYDRACLLLALQAIDPGGQRDWIEDLARELVQTQEADGDWGYPGGGDLSNTQYAALALRAAQAAGVDIEPRVWSRLARDVLRYRTKDGGFGYVVGAGSATGSMTTAGIGTLAICETELARARMLDGELERELPRARAAGWRWLDEHFSVDSNPGGGAWLHYYLYGLERAGALAGVERIGERDWYTDGARFLLDTQDGAGEWHGTFEREGTLFALLFLRRATHARAPRTVEPGERHVERQGVLATGPVWFSAEGDGPLALSIEGFGPEVRSKFDWPNEQRAGLRIVRVEYLASETPIAVALGDPSRAASTQRFQVDCAVLPPGKHTLRARVLVREPVRAPLDPRAKKPKVGEEELGPVRVILSHPLVVEVRSALPPHASLGEPRVNPLAHSAATASSFLRRADGFEFLVFASRNAVDGNPRTPWIADPKDANPKLHVKLAESIVIERIHIRPPRLAPTTPERFQLPAEVDVCINAAHPERLVLDRAGGTYVLPALKRVTSIEVRLVGRSTEERLLGIGELEVVTPRE